MADREFDPGRDTPTAYEPGAGQPVPGSPVYEEAERLKEFNQQETSANIEAAQDAPDRGDGMTSTSTNGDTTGEPNAANTAKAADSTTTAKRTSRRS